MPEYNAAATSKPNLTSGYASAVWNAEGPGKGSPPAGNESQSISLPRDANMPNCVSVQVEFSGDPGVFQIDLQTADTDADKYYVTKASLAEDEMNDAFVARMEVTSIVAKYARLKMITLTNDVTVIAKIF